MPEAIAGTSVSQTDHAEAWVSPFEPPEGAIEAYAALLDLAQRRTGAIPAELLVNHVLDVTQGADWPVRRAAMEALLRRLRASERDELRIASRPDRRRVLGPYRTRRSREQARPYSTVLHGLLPPRGSCDCPDFLKNSLGLCKHILVVMQDLCSSPTRVRAAINEQESPEQGAWSSWNPVKPLTGPGDWLARVRLPCPAQVATRRRGDARRATGLVRKDGHLVVADQHLSDPERRQGVVRELLSLTLGQRRQGAEGVANPALLALLKREEAKLLRENAGVTLVADTPNLLKSLRQPLYPYQLEGVKGFLRRGRLLLADDMGLGKTAQAIACCHALWHAGRSRRGLLIVPSALKPQWLREWQHFTDVPVAIVDGGPGERSARYRTTKEGFLIGNYEQVLRDLPLIRRFAPGLVVLDEAQRIKNWATKTAAYVKQLDPPYRLVLTGTPMENRLEELASILGWVDDDALAPAWRLAPAHTTLVDGTREVSGARNLGTLRLRLAPHMLRRLRSEVLDQLPARTDTRVPVELTDEQADAHDALDQPIKQIMSRAQRRPLTPPEFLKLMQMLTLQRIYCNGLGLAQFKETWPSIEKQAPSETLLRSLFSPKLFELRGLVDNLVVAQQRKVVIFSQWRRMLQLIQWATADILARAGTRAVFFSGREGQARRVQNLVDFHDDPRTAVLLCTDAGGVGLNLQRAASCCINVELPWNPAVLEQRIGRIYRLGQENPIEVYNLVSEHGLEAHIADLVASKHALFKGLFDGGSDEVAFDRAGSFLKQLEKIVQPVEVPAEVAEDSDAELDAQVSGIAADDDELPGVAVSLLDDAAQLAAAAPTASLTETPAASGATTTAPIWASSGGDGSGPTTDSSPAAMLSELFAQVQVRPAQAGRVVIEAPAEVAAALASVLAGVSRMLGGVSDR